MRWIYKANSWQEVSLVQHQHQLKGKHSENAKKQGQEYFPCKDHIKHTKQYRPLEGHLHKSYSRLTYDIVSRYSQYFLLFHSENPAVTFTDGTGTFLF